MLTGSHEDFFNRIGPSPKSRDARLSAAVRGIADIKRALIRGTQIL
jgi:hypothetical protein